MDWPGTWSGNGAGARIARVLLLPLSYLYAAGWRAYLGWYRLGLKKRQKPDIAIVGIGSLLVGGSGKTPATIAMAKLLQYAGYRPAVSCSGYGGSGRLRVLGPGEEAPVAEAGDEAVVLREALPDVPIVVGSRRLAAAEAIAARDDFDILVLDDGFQHLPLARSVDIVLLDAARPFGNRRRLPAGPLREPIPSLRRADIIVLTGEGDPELRSRAPVFRAVRRLTALRSLCNSEVRPPESLAGQTVVALSALGEPERFEDTLRALGATVIPRRFPDHHRYTAADLSGLEGKAVVTTAKDAVKLRGLFQTSPSLHGRGTEGVGAPEFWVLDERMEFPDAEGLLAAVFTRITDKGDRLRRG